MPAKVCLIISALVSLIYSLNFILFGDCYVTGGEDCFTILSNDAEKNTQAWGRGGPETGFNGALMFGITLPTLLLLNEGAKGVENDDSRIDWFHCNDNFNLDAW